jgi:hypothetical protein
VLGAAQWLFAAPVLWPLPYMGAESGWGIRITGALILLAPWLPKARGLLDREKPSRPLTVSRWSDLAD